MAHAKDPTAVFQEMIEKDYCSQWMGIEPVLLETGHCIIKMTVKKEMLNGFGILHGGIAFAFADSAFAFAANGLGQMTVSINAQINYHQPAKKGEVLFAEATVVASSKKMVTMDVSITREKDKIQIASFRGMGYRR